MRTLRSLAWLREGVRRARSSLRRHLAPIVTAGGILATLVLAVAATNVYRPRDVRAEMNQEEVTLKVEVITGEGSAREFVGPIVIPLPEPIFRDPFTGEPFINEVDKNVTCENLEAAFDIVIFNCTLHKNIKFKTLKAVDEIDRNSFLGPEGGWFAHGDVRHVTVWVHFSGVADVPGALPGDDVQLEGFEIQQKLVGVKCDDFECEKLEEKDDVELFFVTHRTERVPVDTDFEDDA